MNENLENLNSSNDANKTDGLMSSSANSHEETNRRPLSASSVNVAMTSSNSSPAQHQVTHTFQQIRVNIKCARFTPNGGLFNTKADIYAEMIIDGNPSRKTEIIKKTWSPTWDEKFDVLITPTSRKKIFVMPHSINLIYV